MKANVLSAAVLMSVLAAAPAPAQQQGDRGREQQQTVEVVDGELLKVDPDARTISVRAPGGAEIQFAYTNETVITGSEEQTQGLATIEGTHVRVYFTRSDDAYTATRVVVEPEE
jgi:hypothetical protein